LARIGFKIESAETLFLQTIYVLFFIEHGSRRVHIAACTCQPEKLWVRQQARQMTWMLEDYDPAMRFSSMIMTASFRKPLIPFLKHRALKSLIHRDKRRMPTLLLNAGYARCAKNVWLNSLFEAHLRRVLREYTTYYNSLRPHQGIKQSSPNGFGEVDTSHPVRGRSLLGGIIKDYYRQAACCRYCHVTTTDF
jgi:putative transposase